MSQSDRIKREISDLEARTSFQHRDSLYYSRRAELDSRLRSANADDEENRRLQAEKEEEEERLHAVIAAASYDDERKFKESVKAYLTLTTDEKDYTADINVHLLNKATPIVAKRLLLDALINELGSMLGDDKVEQAVGEARQKLLPQSGPDMTAKYIDIILSKGKTAHVSF